MTSFTICRASAPIPDPGDAEVLRHGLRLLRTIVRQPAFDGLRGDEMSPGASAVDDTAIERHIRGNAQSYYHPVGTCRMGVDAQAVVDPQLRVRGIDALRLVDASVMPVIPRANTNAATIMIGEKGAAMIAGAA